MTDRVTSIVEAVRLRLDEELRRQIEALTADHEQALETQRRTTELEAQAAETRWSSLLESARTESQQLVATAVAAARQEFDAEREAERETERRGAGRDLDATRDLVADLDRCATLTDVLNHLAGAVAARPGGGLFVVQDGTVQPWRAPGGSVNGLPLGWEGLVDPAVRERRIQRRDGSTAVPVTIDRAVVAVIVSPAAGAHDVTPELLASAGAARLTALTAARLLQAERWTADTIGRTARGH